MLKLPEQMQEAKERQGGGGGGGGGREEDRLGYGAFLLLESFMQANCILTTLQETDKAFLFRRDTYEEDLGIIFSMEF